MELIDRYIQAVGKYLPEKKRNDVMAEIRSLLEDTLEHRSEKPTEADVVAVLKEFGSPAKVAASYGSSTNMLIGPQQYPTFLLVLQLGMSVQLIVHGVFLAIGLLDGTDPGAAIWGAISNFLEASLQMFGIMVIIFALMERSGVDVPIKEGEWDPRSLPKIEDKEKVSRFESALEIAFTLVALGALQPFSDWAGPYMVYVRWASVLFIGIIFLTVFLVYKGRWQTGTRIISLTLSALWMWFFITVARLDWMAILTPIRKEAGNDEIAMWVTIGFSIAAVFSLFNIGTQLWRLFNPTRSLEVPAPGDDKKAA